MTSFPDPARFARRSLAAALFATAMSTCASAADMPETILRGGTYSEPSPDYMRWDGVSLGATFGWTNITVDYSSAFAVGTTTKDQTNSAQFGGFLGYNWQWETLVLGVEGAYNRPASLDSSGTDAGQSATYKLIDYGTVRARAGYAYGHFLPSALRSAGSITSRPRRRRTMRSRPASRPVSASMSRSCRTCSCAPNTNTCCSDRSEISAPASAPRGPAWASASRAC